MAAHKNLYCVLLFSSIAFCAHIARAEDNPATPPDTASLGIEGFHDFYREPDLDVTTTTNYGSLTGNYTTYFDQIFFAAADGRASYGTDHYKSPSGTASGNPQWETDLRGRVGLIFWSDEDGDQLAPYTGVGLRYFEDEGKGSVTSIGDVGYDRRIMQLYLPLGVTYTQHMDETWSLIPTIEYDQLLWGQVNSRLQNNGPLCFAASGNFPGGCTASGVNPYNTQAGGFGLRGDLMLRDKIGTIASWEIGPFVRYWDIHKSNNLYYPLTGTAAGYSAVIDEPSNDRLQLGLKLNVLW